MDELGYKIMICGSTIWLIYKQVRAAYEELMSAGQVNPDRYTAPAGTLPPCWVWTPSTRLEKKYGIQDVGTDVASLAAAQAAQMAADAAVLTPADY